MLRPGPSERSGRRASSTTPFTGRMRKIPPASSLRTFSPAPSWSRPMPLIQITLLKGRTTDQKRRIAQRMTDVLVEEAKTAKEGVVVTFVDVEKDSYARGGELMLDKK